MPSLTPAQKQLAEELAEKIFNWERISEDHAAVLRTDPQRLEAVYMQYAADAPPVGFLPPPELLDSSIAQAELDLQSTATTFAERLKAISCCLFLCRVTMTRASLQDAVYLELLRMCTALHDQYYGNLNSQIPVAPPTQLHPLPAKPSRGLEAPATPSDPQVLYPIALPARSFTFDEIGTRARVRVDGAAIAEYRRTPDRLPEYIFVSETPEGLEEAFRVSCILTSGSKEKLFYLVFAGEGAEAVCHSSEEFFELLSSSSRVVNE
ncbi:hypothetical protein B0H15DRAFT_145943 [Mycena belliarum]|uniref:Uncharacterized protein n=1 Tax=Mycena belliarum TaxID=1033014 RepID=A0AAD6UDN2_9AGAR|nr:hypothetical protein B0H15DRAFT_145943 [Mycena belliae]